MKRLLVAAAITYLLFLLWYICPYAGGSDSSGYLNSAKLFRAGELTAPLLTPPGFPLDELSPDLLAPLGFTTRRDGAEFRLVPTYPAGLPLHLVLASFLTGLAQATVAVNLFAAFGLGVLLYLTAREFGVRPDWAAGLTLVAALSPLVVLYTLQCMSDLLAATWALAAVFCALRSDRGLRWTIAAGVALAIGVLVRPTNLLLLIPVLICLRTEWRTWLVFGASGLPGALFLLYCNHQLYQNAFSTGYGTPPFDAGLIPVTLWHYVVWLPVVATPLILAAAALPWVQIDVRRRLALVTWAGTFLLLYGTYSCTHEEWWYLRFLLPALPALLIGAALALQSLVQAQWVLSSQLVFPHRRVPEGPVRRWTISLPALLLVAALGWQLEWCRHFDVRHVELNERNYRDVSRWIADQLPERSLIAASQTSGAIFFYSDKLAVRWDRLTPESYARLNGYLDQQRLTLYAALFKHERAAALEKAMPGRWESVANFRDVIVWRRSQTTPAEGSAAP